MTGCDCRTLSAHRALTRMRQGGSEVIPGKSSLSDRHCRYGCNLSGCFVVC